VLFFWIDLHKTIGTVAMEISTSYEKERSGALKACKGSQRMENVKGRFLQMVSYFNRMNFLREEKRL
jgi:hypothetical protein